MLRWHHDWGAKIEYWERKAANGERTPEPFYERPEIAEGLEYLWIAFHDLGTERQIGMGIGPIPRSQARAYAAELGIDPDDGFDRFWSIIRAVDNAYLEIANAPNAAPDPAADRSSRSKPKAKPLARQEG